MTKVTDPVTTISFVQKTFEELDNNRSLLNFNVKKNGSKVVENLANNRWIPVPLRRYAGFGLTFISSFFLSLGVLIGKVLGSKYGFHPYIISFWRYLGVVTPSLPILFFVERNRLAKKKDSVFSTIWPLGIKNSSEKWWRIFGLLVRGLLSGLSVILRYHAFEYLSIGDTTVITFASPVVVTVLAHFCLKEKFGIVPFLAAITTFVGVLVMTRPPFLTGEESYQSEKLIGIAFATGSLLCFSTMLIISQKIRNVDFSVTTVTIGLLSLGQAFVLTQVFDAFHYPTDYVSAAYVTVFMSIVFIGQTSIILALTMEQAGPVSLIRSCDVIFAFVFQFIFLGVTPDVWSAVGGTIVVICIGIIALRKWISELPEDDKKRQQCRFLLKKSCNYFLKSQSAGC